jgi:hypothetical protein
VNVWPGLLAAVACTAAGCGSGRPTSVEPRSADAFLDSIGVQVHVAYYDTAYGRFDAWARAVRSLGVHHIRDGLAPNDPTDVARVRALAADGIKITLGSSLDGAPGAPASAARGPLRGAVDAIEAPNEPEIFGGPGWPQRLRAFLPAMRAALRTGPVLRLPLVGPSFTPAQDSARFRDLAAQVDVLNVHPYPGGKAPEQPLADALATVRGVSPGTPVQATETGYHTALRENVPGQQPPVSEAAEAIYTPRLVASAFAQGYQRTFIYELLDEKPDPALADPEQHFGLLRVDLTPKPAYTALRNLIAEVRASSGPGERVPVEVEGAVDKLLLERRDGSQALLLWRAEPVWDRTLRQPLTVPTLPVRVTFPRGARDLAVYRPSMASRPSLRRAHARDVGLAVGADVTVVDFR